MTRSEFWRLIDTARRKAKRDPNAQLEILALQLATRSDADIRAFDRILRGYWIRAYTSELWGAAFLAGGGCSDDGFMDFRGWLVSRGRAAYEGVLRQPDRLATILAPGESGQEMEGFYGVASLAWAQKHGASSVADWSHVPHPKRPRGKSWRRKKPEALYPRLCARGEGRRTRG